MVSLTEFVVCFCVFLDATASTATEVTLLDSTTEDSLDWMRYPFRPTAPTPGWVEESYTDFEKGINWRSYVVCDVSFKQVDNWLWTPFIERGPAKRIYVEMKFSVRDCSLYPGTTRSCKETFSLLYYEFDAATREPPPWQPESYVLVDRIAADEGRFSQNSEVIINTEVRSVPATKRGLYFAFRDQGGCISLLAVRVYYKTCPEVVQSLVRYPATPTGEELTSVERTTGQCVANAVPANVDMSGVDSVASSSSSSAAASAAGVASSSSSTSSPPAFMCTADGTWVYQQGRCHCVPGYEPDAARRSCQICPPGRYQPEVGGPLGCRPCPPHSSAPTSGLSSCRCDAGYYRSATDPNWSPCSRPPSAPLNLSVSFVDQAAVALEWHAPIDAGGRQDLGYRVECDVCLSSATYRPPGFADGGIGNETRVTIAGLRPVTKYRFRVYAVNGVSEFLADDRQQFLDITVTTEAAVPSMVSNVHVAEVKPSQMVLAWDPPRDQFGQNVETYEVRYFPRGEERDYVSQTTKRQQLTVLKLQQQTEYGFQVRAKTPHGWGEFSPTVYRSTGQIFVYVGEKEGTGSRIVIGTLAAASVVVFLVAVILLVLRYRRRSRSAECGKEKQPGNGETLEYRSNEVVCQQENPQIITTHTSNMTTPLFTQVGPPRTYVDPHNYEDPHQAVKDFAREIDASCITIEAIIGGGEFGDVCKGKLKYPGRPEICVAIKTLKSGSSDKAKKDFLTEASIMGQFEHSNVIYLQGVVTKSNPIMIITEFMENGSLDTFLRANDGKFLVIQLVAMLKGIASGMQYLSEMGYVHRDLAARNVLVNAQLVCKIADFGLSREIESTTEGAYTTRGGKIPVRWTAPEAIAFRKFTWASDVWSYGIVMWEVMSFGERPYWTWSNQDVIKSIERGYRLPPPMDCPEAIYQLMLDCWQKDRSNRPSFASIVQTLDGLLLCSESLRKLSQTRPHQNPLAPDVPDMTKFSCVEEWLASIRMSRYLENFERAGVTSMEAVMRLSPQDLAVVGVALVGHQKKILNSVQTMRAQVSINVSDGFLV